MSNISDQKCIAILSCDNSKKCKNKRLKDKDFCGIHIKMKNIVKTNTELKDNIILLSLKNIENTKYQKIKYNNIKYTLNYYKIESTKKKKTDFIILSNFLRIINNLDINKIIKMQSLIRRFIVWNKNKLKGPGLFNRDLINNENDFLSFNSCKNIIYKNFFSYIDSDNFIYAFNIHSIKYLIDNSQNNPYNRKPFSKKCIENVNKLLILNNDSDISIYLEEPKDELTIMKQKCIKVFQRMDDLELYTQPRWFLDLSLTNLINFYIYLKDLWDYRVGLTEEMKKKYTKNGKAFLYNIIQIKKLNNKLKLQNLILNDLERLVFEGEGRDNCITACYWILIALTMVSKNAAEGCSELVQSNNI